VRHFRLALLALLFPMVASAHDFWIEPATFRPAVGKMVPIGLRVGQGFIGDPVPRDSSLIDRFISQSAAGEKPIAGFEKHDPAGLLRVETPGLIVVGFRSHPVSLDLTAEKFNESLKLEGLDRIIELRAKRGETNKPDHEIFSRCAKALLVAGGAPAATNDVTLGFRLELVRESESSFRLLFEGKPLAGALVVALQQDDPSIRLSARSDKKGRVSFTLTKNGVWLVKSVHMIPAPPASGAEWESLWASLTFER
jgi:hypothetical protein